MGHGPAYTFIRVIYKKKLSAADSFVDDYIYRQRNRFAVSLLFFSLITFLTDYSCASAYNTRRARYGLYHHHHHRHIFMYITYVYKHYMCTLCIYKPNKLVNRHRNGHLYMFLVVFYF